MTKPQKTIRTYKEFSPRIGSEVFIADTAVVIGDVDIGDQSSIWYNVVIRGDINSIRVGKRTNLQDGTVVHVDHEQYSVQIGDDVTIGHNATVHGCTIESRCLIGMGATLLSGAKIESEAIVAAGSVVLENQTVPAGTLVAGVPAKPIRNVTDAEIEKIEQSARHYIAYAKSYMQ